MLILENEQKLNRGIMESGVIFNHDAATSMGSMTTKVYMANLAGNSPSKINANVVKDFSAATATRPAPMNTTPDNTAPSATTASRGTPATGATAAEPTSNGARTGSRCCRCGVRMSPGQSLPWADREGMSNNSGKDRTTPTNQKGSKPPKTNKKRARKGAATRANNSHNSHSLFRNNGLMSTGMILL
mmetsp:Transcript_14629/g.26490  ORF Transcript_14629/g.26490 Transcript_14629/m.26490 type:complete len:187 (-) Transcript_14629:636-1196(-)